MIHYETWKRARALLVRNGIEPTHPAFASDPAIRARAVRVLMAEGDLSPQMAIALVKGFIE
jgi:hypothetical protein